MEIINPSFRSSFPVEIIEYTPDPIDEYIVIVNDANDWEEIHNYIINENEIDGIPNRKIECINLQEFSLRTAIYLISREESDILRTHEKIESVQLNPDKYPQPKSSMLLRFYNNKVAFNKPVVTAALGDGLASTTYKNGVRGNWSHLFVNDPSSLPFRGVGIVTTSKVDSKLSYNRDGTNVDAVIIDEGVAYLHPEFLKDDGTTRVRDVILDGPYKVDPTYFDTRALTYTKIVDGVDVGVGIATTAANEWWTNTLKRSSQFSSLGTLSSLTSLYTLAHVSTKTPNFNGNQIAGGHGTACASQIGGKTFGLAFNCNIWNIRIAISGAGGYLDPFTALNACTIFHNAKKISQGGDPDPTLINNSYGASGVTGNIFETTYTIGYRGNTQTYIGTGAADTPPSNCGSARNHALFRAKIPFGAFFLTTTTGYSGSGRYLSADPASNSGAENAIAAGCIVVASAGNDNQKLSDPTDVDYNNWYGVNTEFINRVNGVQKGGSGDITNNQGSIRVGALDCAVEPAGSRQGSSAFSVRRVCYSNNGPMIDVWAPAEMTMAAGYTTNYEDYVRSDNSSFYDSWFNGTSSAGPNTCSVIALYLQNNRPSDQSATRTWLKTDGSVAINLSDPYSNVNDPNYWSRPYNSSTDDPDLPGDCYNFRGNSNLRGATNRVLSNPFRQVVGIAITNSTAQFASGSNLSFEGVNISLELE
jgi:hypothetical protein